MNFEAFVDAVDTSVREGAGKHYGVFRGPHVAYWQWGSSAARLREGLEDQIELTLVDDEVSTSIVFDREADSVERVAERIATALVHGSG